MNGISRHSGRAKRDPESTGTATRIAVLLMAACVVPSAAYAAAWQQDLSISSTAEYDSNPNLRADDRGSVWRARVVPGLALRRIDGADELHAAAQMRFERSTDSSRSADRNDPSITLGWRRATERGGFGLAAAYDRSTTRLTELEESGVTRGDNTRVNRTLSADWSTAVTERMNLTVDSGYQVTSYDGEGLVDRSILSGGLRLGYSLSPVLEPFASLSASHTDPDDGDSSRLIAGSVGLKWQATEQLDWTVHGGATHVSRQDENDGDDGAGWQGGVMMHYITARTNYTLDISRSTNASATTTGQFATVKQARGSASYAIDERTSVGTSLSWRRVDNESPVTLRQLGVWLSYELAPAWQARLAYLYKERDESGFGNATASVIGVTLSYNYSNF